MAPKAWILASLMSLNQTPTLPPAPGLIPAPAVAPAGAEVVHVNKRLNAIPCNFPESRKAEIRELHLYASRDQGETWTLANKIDPGQREFAFNAPLDGLYWLSVAVVDRNGRQSPENVYKVSPNLKLQIDTLRPLAKIVSAQRSGAEITVAWEIQEANPDWTTFRLEWESPTGGGATPVAAAPGLTGQAKFTPSTQGPVLVRLSLRDQAKNEVTVGADVRGLEVAAVSGSAPVAAPALPSTLPNLPSAGSLPSSPALADAPPALPIAPQVASPMPAAPPAESIALPGNPSGTTLPPTERPRPFVAERAPVPLMPPGSKWNAGASATTNYQPPPERPIASTEFPPVVPAQYQTPAPIVAPMAPRKALPALQYVNSPEVLLEYELSKVGPSGVGSVDIYLTQDDGQTWDHVASDPAVIGKTVGGRHQGLVELPGDGIYGFTLVVKSQAQIKQELAAAEKKAKGPRPGDVPEIRVEVDTSTPTAELYPPRRDPNKSNALLMVWTANDKNLGANPVTLEYAERREGPWMPIASNIPNAKQYSWQLPDRLPVQVYMRLRVRDLAGNEGVAVTPEPQLVDLSEPEGRLLTVTTPPRR